MVELIDEWIDQWTGEIKYEHKSTHSVLEAQNSFTLE